MNFWALFQLLAPLLGLAVSFVLLRHLKRVTHEMDRYGRELMHEMREPTRLTNVDLAGARKRRELEKKNLELEAENAALDHELDEARAQIEKLEHELEGRGYRSSARRIN